MSRLAGADAFFVYVDSVATPQLLGGLVVMDHDATDAAAYRDRLTAVTQAHLPELPRFGQRIVVPKSRWRRPRWAPVAELDWCWHIPLRDLTDAQGNPGGTSALNSLVAELQCTPLPRDRPPWRFVVATGFSPGKLAAILIVHHAVGDGLQILAQTGALLEPRAAAAPPPRDRPGLVRRAVGTVIGVAQLTTDGNNHHLLASGDGIRFGALAVPLAHLRDAARAHRVSVTDVLLDAMAGALSRLLDPVPPTVRVEVPVTMRVPGTHRHGNATAAVMIKLPLDPMPESDRLAEIGRRSQHLDIGTRALGSRFVIGVVCEMLPAPVLSRFARTVYGHRFFQAIMSNMPGPVGTYRLAGAAITEVYPIVPLAPRVPLAVGSLSWGATMFLGVSIDPVFVDVDGFMAAFQATLADLLSAGVCPTAWTNDSRGWDFCPYCRAVPSGRIDGVSRTPTQPIEEHHERPPCAASAAMAAPAVRFVRRFPGVGRSSFDHRHQAHAA